MKSSVLIQKFVASRIVCPVLWVGRAAPAMPKHRQAVLTPSSGRDKRPVGRAFRSHGLHRAAPVMLWVMLQHHGAPHSLPKARKARPGYHELLNQDTRLKRDLVIDIHAAADGGGRGRAGRAKIVAGFGPRFVGAAALTTAIKHGQLTPVTLQHDLCRVFFNA